MIQADQDKEPGVEQLPRPGFLSVIPATCS